MWSLEEFAVQKNCCELGNGIIKELGNEIIKEEDCE